MSLFFTADTHFNHDTSFAVYERGFSCLHEMNTVLINNWNSKVGPRDDVWVVGDFICGNPMTIPTILGQLNGRIHLVRGNHDTDEYMPYYKRFLGQKLFHIYGLGGTHIVTAATGNQVLLKHQPPADHVIARNPICIIHGHVHSKELFTYGRPNLYNVCTDAHSFMPVSIEEIVSDLYNKCPPRYIPLTMKSIWGL
jgi:calcineurin-like phosphoesterase family protein